MNKHESSNKRLAHYRPCASGSNTTPFHVQNHCQRQKHCSEADTQDQASPGGVALLSSPLENNEKQFIVICRKKFQKYASYRCWAFGAGEILETIACQTPLQVINAK